MLGDILEEHLDEAAFLFDRRELEHGGYRLSPQDLDELRERLRAHLDGLLLGGDEAWELCGALLRSSSLGEAGVAALVAMEAGRSAWLGDLSDALAEGSTAPWEGLRAACGVTEWPGLAAFLLDPLARSRAHLAAGGPVAPAAARLLGTAGGEEDLAALVRAVMSEDPVLARQAVLALGDRGDPRIVPTLLAVLEMPELAGFAGAALLEMFGPECPVESAGTPGVRGDEEEAEAWSPGADLPRLSPVTTGPWWQANAGRFTAGMRHRWGLPISDPGGPP